METHYSNEALLLNIGHFEIVRKKHVIKHFMKLTLPFSSSFILFPGICHRLQEKDNPPKPLRLGGKEQVTVLMHRKPWTRDNERFR
jgi:hypothetical protein